MKPDTSNWRDQTSYDYFDALPTEGLAWECLRRATDYQHLYDRLIAEQLENIPLSNEAERRWGLRFRRLTEPIVLATGHTVVDQRQFRRPRALSPFRRTTTIVISTNRRPWRSTP
jgi:hypothetical protein